MTTIEHSSARLATLNQLLQTVIPAYLTPAPSAFTLRVWFDRERIPRFKSKDELLEEEFAKFVADFKPEEAEAIPAIKNYFKAYITSDQVRHIIESKQFTDLATNPIFSTRDFRAVPQKYRTIIPEYVKDYVSLNQFAA